MSIADRLTELGIVLPEPRLVPANFVPVVQIRDLLWVSGTLGTVKTEDGRDVIPKPGKVGRDVTLEEAYQSARQCAINHLSWLQAYLGDLERIIRFVKLNGYVNAVEGYAQGPWVVNGASDLLVEAFGKERGQHARAVVSVAGLAFEAPVEVEMLVQVEQSQE